MSARVKNLENPKGKVLASNMGGPQGSLPGNTKVNPKEQAKTITLRSRKIIDESSQLEKNSDAPQRNVQEEEVETPIKKSEG